MPGGYRCPIWCPPPPPCFSHESCRGTLRKISRRPKTHPRMQIGGRCWWREFHGPSRHLRPQPHLHQSRGPNTDPMPLTPDRRTSCPHAHTPNPTHTRTSSPTHTSPHAPFCGQQRAEPLPHRTPSKCPHTAPHRLLHSTDHTGRTTHCAQPAKPRPSRFRSGSGSGAHSFTAPDEEGPTGI